MTGSTSGQLPIMVLYSSDGTVSWSKRLYKNQPTNVGSIAFKADNSEVVAVMGDYNLSSKSFAVMRFNVSNGDFILGYQGTSTQQVYVGPNSATISGGNIYIGMQNQILNAEFLGFTLGSNSVQSPLFYKQTTDVGCSITNVFVAPSGNIAYTGNIFYSGSTYMAYLEFATDDGDLQLFDGIDQTSLSSKYTVKEAFLTQHGTANNFLYFTGIQGSCVAFIQLQFPAPINLKTFYFDFNDGLSYSAGLYSYQVDEAWTYIQTGTTNDFFLTKINFDTPSLTQKKLSNLSGLGNFLNAAKFTSTQGNSYYVADINALVNPQDIKVTLTQQSAGLIPEVLTPGSNTCLQQSDNQGTPMILSTLSLPPLASILDPLPAIGAYQTGDPDPKQQPLQLDLLSQSWCQLPALSVSVPTSGPFSYVVGAALATESLDDGFVTQPVECQDATFTCVLTYQNGSSLNSPPFTWSGGNPTVLDIYTTSTAFATKYSLEFSANVNQDSDITGSTAINVHIINPCAYDSLVATSPFASSPFTYYISDTNTFDFSTYFNGNVSNCAITYEAFSDSGLTIPITTPPFSISSSGVLTVSSSDPALDSTTYDIYVAAYATDNGPSSKVVSLIYFFFSGCKVNTAIIPTYSNIQYLIKSPQLTLNFTNWTSKFSPECGTFAPVAEFSNNSQVPTTGPAPIVYNTEYNSFIIQTNSFSDYGPQQITISGNLDQGWMPENRTFIINITTPCEVHASSVPSQSYMIGSLPPLNISVPTFTLKYCGAADVVTYEASYNGGTPLPSWLVFNSSTMNFTVNAKTLSSVGVYYVNVKGTTYDNSTYYSDQLQFTLNVTQLKTAPPLFVEDLLDQNLTAGNSSIYKLPSVYDTNGDSYTITVKLGSAQSFIQFKNGAFIITPPAVISGSYPISVTLVDTGSKHLSFTYLMTVTVTQPPKKITHNQTSPNRNAEIPRLQANASNAEIEAYNQKMVYYQNFGAMITFISQGGLVRVYFTDQIIQPHINLTSVNNSIIDVSIIPGAFNNPSYLNFTWNMTYLNSYYFELQLNFQDPYYVSYDVYCGQQFVRTGTGCKWNSSTMDCSDSSPQGGPQNPITKLRSQSQGKCTLPVSIYRMNSLAAQVYQAVGSSTSQVLVAFAISNFFVNVILSASLSQLWSMINVLQIICQMPLINIRFAENAYFVYALFMNIVQFNLIPSSTIDNALFNVNQVLSSQAFTPAFNDLDIF